MEIKTKKKLNKIKNKIIKNFSIKKLVVVLIVVGILLGIGLPFKNEIELYINGVNANPNLDYSGVCAYYLDVGQGDCTFISYPDGKTMLIDSGTSKSIGNILNNLLEIYKDKELVIDYLILTHSDKDHSGGMLEIVNIFQINNIIRPRIYDCYNGITIDYSRDENAPSEYASENDLYYHKLIESFYAEPYCNVEFFDIDKFNNEFKIYGGELDSYYDLTFYSPTRKYYGNSSDSINNFSPVFTINYNDRKMLFTGDASSLVEQEILEDIPDVDVLKVAHHGSKYSTSEEFVNKISPEYAIISVGKNSYGHPTNEVLNLLNKYSCKIYRTDINGNVILNIARNGNIAIYAESNDQFYIKVEYIIIGLTIICIYLVFFVEFPKNNSKKQLKINN